MSYSWLPNVLAEIAELVGLDAALALAKARGGTQIYIPAKLTDDHWLIDVVGKKAAQALCQHFQINGIGLRLDIPLGPTGSIAETRANVDKMLRQGKSEMEIALATGMSGRGVRKRRAKMRQAEASGQKSLFDTA